MSNLIFPSSLNGYTWDSKKKPVFNNITHSSPTGRDVRIALYDQPIFEFTLSNQWMTKADKDTLLGFFMARRGSFDSFLYADEDSATDGDVFGTGDGTIITFQLGKWLGSFPVIVNNVVGQPSIYLNDVLLTNGVHYTLSTTGLVTVAALAGQQLKWSGSAYYRCVFLEDSLEYNQFAESLYDCNEIKFKGCFANKL